MDYKQNTVSKCVALLHGVTYKPGWNLRFEQSEIASNTIQFTATYMAPDSYHPERKIPVLSTKIIPVPVAFTDEEAMKYVIEEVFAAIMVFERHEALEFFKIDGNHWRNPHRVGHISSIS